MVSSLAVWNGLTGETVYAAGDLAVNVFGARVREPWKDDRLGRAV